MECTKRNNVYLLLNSRKIVKRLEGMMREISRALGLISVSSLELLIGISEEIESLCDDMIKAEFVGFDCGSGWDFGGEEDYERRSEDFKNEIEYVLLRKDKAKAIQMDQPFYCPITRDVMVDPAETSSKQTFERSAIEKLFSDGNYLCLLAMAPLNPEILRHNKTLRQSIEE
ncbi:hypothetical protein GIB67_036638 [Kingdonia uniflora]|uniref:U-box domain-containing protein n=1 Tax=Kingdonia uniflora TaxID=39325 RepID=A0A7J7LWF9_9MAGN|nr:hypothetical protein GIB67_036638 [Kingdonia uniflora]